MQFCELLLIASFYTRECCISVENEIILPLFLAIPPPLCIDVCVFINTIGSSYYKLLLNKNCNISYQLFMICSLIIFRFTAFLSISKRMREQKVEQLMSQLSSTGRHGIFPLHSVVEVHHSCATVAAFLCKMQIVCFVTSLSHQPLQSLLSLC